MFFVYLVFFLEFTGVHVALWGQRYTNLDMVWPEQELPVQIRFLYQVVVSYSQLRIETVNVARLVYYASYLEWVPLNVMQSDGSE